MSHEDCRHELLASSEIGQVAVCQNCGQVHLNLQYITLRFEAAGFRALANMVSQAQHQIDRVTASKAAVVKSAAAGVLH